MFYKKVVLKKFAKFTGKHLYQRLLFSKVAGLRPLILLEKRLWYRYFSVNLAEFLGPPYFEEHLRTTASIATAKVDGNMKVS